MVRTLIFILLGLSLARAEDNLNAYRNFPVLSGTASVKQVGRFAGNSFTWPGTSLSARFKGIRVSVSLTHTYAFSGNPIFYLYIVDGQAPKRFSAVNGTQVFTLAENLDPAKIHDLILIRDSEGNQGISTFNGFDFGVGGSLQAPFANGKKMEVIGDSISAGYGNLGTVPGCHYSNSNSSVFYTYGYVLSRALGMDLTDIAFSGRGIVHNYGAGPNDPQNPTMRHDYLYALTPHIYNSQRNDEGKFLFDFASQPAPDLVLINLGTNDLSANEPGAQDMKAAYASLVQIVRARSPLARIVLTNGSMLSGEAFTRINSYLQDVAKNSGPQVYFLPLQTQNTALTGVGCDGHPNIKENQHMADQLLPGLMKILQSR